MQIQWDLPPQESAINGGTSDRAYLQLLIEHSPIAIVTLNSSHQAQDCNPTFEKMFGYTRAEIINTSFDDLIASGDKLDEARGFTLSVLHGDKTHMVTRRQRKGGEWIDVDIHGIPLIVDGVLRGVYGLYVDITERTRAESSLRQLSLELMHLQENEKRRIARELHDATSQELALLSLSLGKLQRKLPGEDRELQDLLDTVKELTRQCTQKIRSASYLLHPPLLQEAGLVPAISWLAEGFAQRTGIRVHVRISPKLGRLAEMAEMAIFRVVQESLSNVLRHSNSKVVEIRLSRRPGTINLSVKDRRPAALDGARPQAIDTRPHAGVGITGMKERVQELGGQLDVRTVTGGMIVVASLPARACA
jgi:two-component system, NarL family, sensor kinase